MLYFNTNVGATLEGLWISYGRKRKRAVRQDD